jgi:hypothetical protein
MPSVQDLIELWGNELLANGYEETRPNLFVRDRRSDVPIAVDLRDTDKELSALIYVMRTPRHTDTNFNELLDHVAKELERYPLPIPYRYVAKTNQRGCRVIRSFIPEGTIRETVPDEVIMMKREAI